MDERPIVRHNSTTLYLLQGRVYVVIMAKTKPKVKTEIMPKLGWAILLGLSLGLVSTVSFFWYFQNRFYPGVMIDSVPVGGLTLSQARAKIADNLSPLPDTVLTLTANTTSLSSSSAQLGFSYDFETTLGQAYQHGRQGKWRFRPFIIAQTWYQGVRYQPKYQADPDKLAEFVKTLAAQVEDPGELPAAILKTSGVASSLEIRPGKQGLLVDEAATLTNLAQNIGPENQTWSAVIKATQPPLSETEQQQARDRSLKLIGKSIFFKNGEYRTAVSDRDMIGWLAFPTGTNQDKLEETTQSIAKQIDRQPQEPEFTYNPDTLQVTAFTPPRDGLQLDAATFQTTLEQSLAEFEALDPTSKTKQLEKELPLSTSSPTRSLGETNKLGIQERIGLGESEYAHSIPSRIHNVALASSRINNYLVKPGEEFSFNKALGDVSKETGFQPAYVIRSGQTVLGDGGGVCQVSTTTFRAVLNAGLPVTKRRAHSYRVSYYELDSKPGVDATVYSGDVDLRFKNDTGHHILIHTQTDSKKLYMRVELYGTSDGRTTEIVDHKTWDARPAPPAVYIPDPSLPAGTVKQVDWAASGIRASFKNVVKDKTGQVLREEVYTSNYIPWSAKYLQGVGQ